MKDPAKETRCKTIAMAATVREKIAFESFCEQRDLLPGQMLRLMFLKVCPNVLEAEEQPERVQKDASLYLRLAHTDADEVRARAAQEGTTPQGWVRRLIRSTLHQTPQFSRDEENALLASNRELAHLGRNINQIARQLNDPSSGADPARVTQLATLPSAIEDHRAKVAALINASWGRYGGEGKS